MKPPQNFQIWEPDDKMHPLQEFQCGAVVKSPDKELTNYVNYPENVFTLQQGTMPLFTLEMILEEEGVLNDIKVRGIKYIQPHCVDDPPVRVGHPIFMDHCLAKKANCTDKVMGKSVLTEALGITRKAEDHYQLVKYPKTSQKSATMLHCTVVSVIEQQCSTTQRQG